MAPLWKPHQTANDDNDGTITTAAIRTPEKRPAQAHLGGRPLGDAAAAPEVCDEGLLLDALPLLDEVPLADEVPFAHDADVASACASRRMAGRGTWASSIWLWSARGESDEASAECRWKNRWRTYVAALTTTPSTSDTTWGASRAKQMKSRSARMLAFVLARELVSELERRVEAALEERDAGERGC